MKISARNFMASQALYGLMISQPNLGEDEWIKRANRIADKMIAANKKKASKK